MINVISLLLELETQSTYNNNLIFQRGKNKACVVVVVVVVVGKQTADFFLRSEKTSMQQKIMSHTQTY